MLPYKDTAILTLAARSISEDRHKYIAARASEYLTKSINLYPSQEPGGFVQYEILASLLVAHSENH